jgi:chitinase
VGTSAGNYPVSAGTALDGSHAAATASGSFWIDATAPSAPTGLRASLKGSRVALSWTAASDGTGGSGVARYEIRRGATQAGTTASTTYSDTPGNGTWTYTVVAVDGAGNASTPSTAVSVKVGRK